VEERQRTQQDTYKPTLSFIKEATMATDDDTSLTADLKARIEADFQKRCYTGDVAQTLQSTAMWLDPHYKTTYLTEEECRNATNKIQEEMIVWEEEQALAGDTGDEARRNEDPNVSDDQPGAKKMNKSLAELLGQVKKKHQHQLKQLLQLLGSILRCPSTSLHPKI
jgi:hypothetical protein